MFALYGLVTSASLVLLGEAQQAEIDPPSDRDVVRALPAIFRLPFVFEQNRDNLVIVKERIAEWKVTIPLLPRARVTVAGEDWKCTAYYTKTVGSVFLFPLKISREDVDVVYLSEAVIQPVGSR